MLCTVQYDIFHILICQRPIFITCWYFSWLIFCSRLNDLLHNGWYKIIFATTAWSTICRKHSIRQPHWFLTAAKQLPFLPGKQQKFQCLLMIMVEIWYVFVLDILWLKSLFVWYYIFYTYIYMCRQDIKLQLQSVTWSWISKY